MVKFVKKNMTAVFVAVGLCLALFLGFNLKNFIPDSLLNSKSYFSMLSYIHVSENGSKYLIDGSNKIIALDKDNNYLFEIKSGSFDEASFTLISSICVDSDGNIYLADITPDQRNNRYDQRARILKFKPNGNFDSVLYDISYDEPYPLLNSSVLNMEYFDGRIYFVSKTESECNLYSIDTSGKEDTVTKENTYFYENANLLLLNFAIDPVEKTVFACSKSGDIYSPSENNTLKMIYDGGKKTTEFFEIPYFIDLNSSATKLFYTDIGTRGIYSIDLNTLKKDVIFESDSTIPLDQRDIFYRVKSIDELDNKVAFCSNYNAYIYENSTEAESFQGYNYKASTRIFNYIYFLCIVLLSLIIIYFLFKFLVYCFVGSKSQYMQTYVFTFAAILILFISITSMITKYTSAQYYNSTIKSLSAMSQMAANYIDGDTLEKINSPEDYMNDDYKLLRQQLNQSFDSVYEWTDTTYCTIYRAFDNVVTYVAFLSDEYSSFYPDSFPYDDSDYQYIFETKEPVVCDGYQTPEGYWMYVTTPIYNSENQIVGVVEVGNDMNMYKESTNEMQKNLLIQIIPITIIIFLIISELINFNSILKKRFKNIKNNKNDPFSFIPVDLVRCFAFVIYLADNFTSILVPILSLKLFTPESGISENLAIALPSSAYALMLTITSFAAGQFVSKVGMRKMFLLGSLLHGAGLYLCGLNTNSLFLFAFSLAVAGVGMGMNLVSLNAYIVMHKKEEEKNYGFSLLTAGTFAGTNCGIILGTNLAENVSYSVVFYVSAFIALLAFIMFFILIKKDVSFDDKEKIQESKNKTFFSLFKFLFSPKVLGYFIFSMIPYLIMGAFIFYFLPIFASSQGWSETYIGILTLLYGICASYLSPILTKYTLNKFGAKLSFLIASAVSLVALGIFVVSPTLSAMIIIVVLMGIADSIGFPSLSVNYVNLKEVKEYGENKAMGIHSVYDGIAQTIGPLIFSTAIAIGLKKGIIYVGTAFTICICLFFVTSFNAKKNIQNDKTIDM